MSQPLTVQATLTLSIGLSLICLLLVFLRSPHIFTQFIASLHRCPATDVHGTRIFVVTPTYARAERLADITRMAQTLMLVPDIEWVVVEDGSYKMPAVERVLARSGLAYHYITAETPPTYRGVWTVSGNHQRNAGIDFVLHHRQHRLPLHTRAVIYFGDDDNAYDYRLFDEYIRKVRRVGVWAVGLAGGVLVVAPHVDERSGLVTGWDGDYRREFDEFLMDVAGFAVGVEYLVERK